MPKKVLQKVAAPKKVVAKKSTAKRKAVATRPLVYAENGSSFWLNDGQVLNSLLALKEALAEMEKAVFSYHVNKDKNDFADWVNHVLLDEDCALDLRKAKTPKSAHTIVVKRLKFYSI